MSAPAEKQISKAELAERADVSKPFRILLLDDSALDAEVIELELRGAGLEFESMHASTREAFSRALSAFRPDLVLADYSMPMFSGKEALAIVRATSKDLPFVLVSGSIGEEAAIEIIKGGATDYVLKDRLVRLAPAVGRALAEVEQKTRRRDAELALAQRAAELERSNAELERSNAELEQFAYICSHDMCEPLRMITMFVELLESNAADSLSEDSREHLRCIVEGALRMRRMLDGLLEYSRARSEPEEASRCDSSRALGAALANLATLLQQSGAVVTRGELPVVDLPESQLVRVFQNLVGNGIKFNRSIPPRIDIGAERDGGRWVFSVRDNGIGVSQEYKETIFRMFQRLHKRTEYPGEGIGLSVCKRVVERHGGRIWLEHDEGGGSVMRFTAQTPDRESSISPRSRMGVMEPDPATSPTAPTGTGRRVGGSPS